MTTKKKTKTIDAPAVDTAIEQRMAAEGAELADTLAAVRDYKIDGPADVEFVTECLTEAKSKWKEFEAQRKSATDPLNAALKTINAWFRPALDALKAIESECKGKLLQATLAAQAEQQKLLEAAREAEAPADIRANLIAASEAQVVAPGVSFRDRWTYTITDAGLIPREYLIPDEAKIAKVVAALKADTAIPGVQVFNDPIVSARAS